MKSTNQNVAAAVVCLLALKSWACSSTSVSSADATIANPSDSGSAPDGGTADDGFTDAGTHDAGCPSDFVDDAGQCELCFDYDLDLGSAEKIRARPRIRRGVVAAEGCEPSTRPGTVLWRAPHDGTWLVDVYGSEASELKGHFDPICESTTEFACDNPSWKPYRFDLTAGTPIVIAVDRDASGGQNRGPGNLMVNIVPLVAEEQGADCLDASDNDLDGLADCDDPTCAVSPECTTPLCAEETLPSIFPVTTEGELTIEGHVNRFPICGGSKTRERVFAWQSPLTGRIVVDADQSKFMSRLSVRRGTCIGPEASSCPARDPYDGGRFVASAIDVTEGEWLYIIIGGIADNLAFAPNNTQEHYKLTIRAPEDESGDRCQDGIDNDGDGTADFYDDDCESDS